MNGLYLFFRIFAEIPLQTNKWYHDILHQLEKSYPVAFDKAVQINANLIGLIPGYTARNDIFQRLNHPESNVRLEAINYIKCQDELCKVRNINYDSRYKLLDKARLHLKIGLLGLFAAGNLKSITYWRIDRPHSCKKSAAARQLKCEFSDNMFSLIRPKYT